jgi:L-ascorbate metabolism protein UlaG (beta-lactamase superfamily)
MLKVFGRNPSGQRLERMKETANFKDGAFHNVLETQVTANDVSMLKMIRDFLNKPSDTAPSKRIPAVKNDLKASVTNTDITWFGHSSYLIRMPRLNVLVDPVMSSNASPFSFFGKAFKGADIYTVDDLPFIDVLLITHDHYDHLDYKTVLRLQNKTKRIITSLGVGEHLEYWKIKNEITELAWWEKTSLSNGITLTATPSRHFSGRSLKRATTLWSSFVLQSETDRIFIGGDSGYDNQFKIIGDQFGPFNLALLDCAQYNDNWPLIHMKPEETVQAALDLHAEILWPVHWGKFALSLHPWIEPVERILKAAEGKELMVTTPAIGETYILKDPPVQKPWWRFEKL